MGTGEPQGRGLILAWVLVKEGCCYHVGHLEKAPGFSHCVIAPLPERISR